MRPFCLQLEASCLQFSFFAYNCVLELFAYNWSFVANNWSFLLTIELLCLQWENASNEHLDGL